MVKTLAAATALAVIWMSSALAQGTVTPEPRTIQVVGIGKASALPTIATVDYTVVGEGRTADEASTALATKQKTIVAGLSGFLGGDTQTTTGGITLIEAHDRACDSANGFNGRPQLAVGVCAATGYIATLQGSIRTAAIAKAGSATGLAMRLGARDARLINFQFADDAPARRAATTAAIADALGRAEVIAAGIGVKLGPVLTIRDQSGVQYGDITVSASRNVMAPSSFPAPPPPLPPVTIDASPRPIETRAQLNVTYALLP